MLLLFFIYILLKLAFH